MFFFVVSSTSLNPLIKVCDDDDDDDDDDDIVKYHSTTSLTFAQSNLCTFLHRV